MTNKWTVFVSIALLVGVGVVGCGDDSSGINNTNHPDGTSSDCGNGVVDPGEACDDGELNSATEPDACRPNCYNHFCGDGIVDSDERCDDGNQDSADGCSDVCEVEMGWDCSGGECEPVCGDNLIVGDEVCDGTDLGGETCISQGHAIGALTCDGCSFDYSGCTGFDCGDGQTDPGEQCDDGNTVACDGCSASCQLEVCGNGTVDCGEACDDGNVIDGDGCNATCTSNESCGNGIVDTQAGEDCDCGGDSANLPSGCVDINGGMAGECTQSCLPVHLWSTSLGGSSNDRGEYVAVDANGRIAIVGAMQGAVSFGGSTFICQGYDVYVVVLDANGAHIWSRQLSSSGSDFPAGVAFDSTGRVIVAGTAAENVELSSGDILMYGVTDSFIVVFDTNGNHVADHGIAGFGATGNHTIEDLAVDSADNIIVGGRYNGRWYCYTAGNCDTDPSGYGGFVRKYDSTLSLVWSENYDSSGDQFIDRVAVDSNDSILFGGIYRFRFDFDGDDHSQYSTSLTAIVAKMTAGAAPLWSHAFADSTNIVEQTLQGLAVGPSDQVVVAMYFDDTMRLDTGVTEGPAADKDAIVVQYDAAGSYQWHVHGYGTGDGIARTVAVDSQGRVWFAGQFEGQIELGGGAFTASATRDLFLARYDSTGNHLWSRQYGISGSNNTFHDIAITPDDQAVAVGTTYNLLDIGGGNLTMLGSSDAMVGVYNP